MLAAAGGRVARAAQGVAVAPRGTQAGQHVFAAAAQALVPEHGALGREAQQPVVGAAPAGRADGAGAAAGRGGAGPDDVAPVGVEFQGGGVLVAGAAVAVLPLHQAQAVHLHHPQVAAAEGGFGELAAHARGGGAQQQAAPVGGGAGLGQPVVGRAAVAVLPLHHAPGVGFHEPVVGPAPAGLGEVAARGRGSGARQQEAPVGGLAHRHQRIEAGAAVAVVPLPGAGRVELEQPEIGPAPAGLAFVAADARARGGPQGVAVVGGRAQLGQPVVAGAAPLLPPQRPALFGKLRSQQFLVDAGAAAGPELLVGVAQAGRAAYQKLPVGQLLHLRFILPKRIVKHNGIPPGHAQRVALQQPKGRQAAVVRSTGFIKTALVLAKAQCQQTAVAGAQHRALAFVWVSLVAGVAQLGAGRVKPYRPAVINQIAHGYCPVARRGKGWIVVVATAAKCHQVSIGKPQQAGGLVSPASTVGVFAGLGARC